MRITLPVCITLLFFTQTLFAQFTKGTRMVGASVASLMANAGSADISVTSIGNSRSKSSDYNINLTPSMGWFISEKTAVGVTLTINPSFNKVSYEERGATFQRDEHKYFNIGLGGFARNYFSKTGSFLPFGQIGLNAGTSKYDTEGFFYGGSGPTGYKRSYSGNTSGGFFFNGSLQAGVTKMLGEHTGLDIYIGYNYNYNKNTFVKTTLVDQGNDGSVDETQENETVTRFTNNGVVIGVGFQIFLGRKK